MITSLLKGNRKKQDVGNYHLTYFLAFSLCLLLLVGCTKEETQTTDSYSKQEIDSKLSEINSRLESIEANQLSGEDLRDIYSLKEEEFDIEFENETSVGCPSRSDVDFWTEEYSQGEISLSKLNKILKKYNDCQD